MYMHKDQNELPREQLVDIWSAIKTRAILCAAYLSRNIVELSVNSFFFQGTDTLSRKKVVRKSVQLALSPSPIASYSQLSSVAH